MTCGNAFRGFMRQFSRRSGAPDSCYAVLHTRSVANYTGARVDFSTTLRMSAATRARSSGSAWASSSGRCPN